MIDKRKYEFCMEMRSAHPEVIGIHHSVAIPEWVELGKNVSIHEGVILGSQGFGFARDEQGRWFHIPHIGKVIIGDDVEIFEGTNICRGTVGNTTIGNGTKIDSLCQIGHNAVIGKNCIITSQCMIAGCVIGNSVWIAPNSTTRPKIVIVDNVFIGQGSNVVRDILTPGSVFAGNPAHFIRMRREDE